MAAKAAEEPKVEEPKAPPRYFIVNPRGIIHEVTKEHAAVRLGQVGYRQATAAEVAALKKAQGNQVFNKPLAKPFSNEPTPVEVVEEA